MATTVSSSTTLVDTAIGPLAVTQATLSGFDIDDFVHSTVIAQATKLQMVYRIQTVDPRLTKGRPPVALDGQAIGGY